MGMRKKTSISATQLRLIAKSQLKGVHVPPAKNGIVVVDAKTVEAETRRKSVVATK